MLSQKQQVTLKKQIQIPDPVYYGPIHFYDGQRKVEYTDCWEISMLRFLHLLFGRDGKIDFDKLTKFMNVEDPYCQKLIAYFKENPYYHMRQVNYKSEQGWLIRSKWCQFVNQCGLLDLKIQGKYQVKATIPNILSFFKGFFPKLSANKREVLKMTHQNIGSEEIFEHYEDILNQLYKQVSLFYDLSVKLVPNYTIQYNYLSFSILQKISINKKHRIDWQINQIYQVQDQEITTRYGGHSDYRYK